jgi:putative endonuclease
MRVKDAVGRFGEQLAVAYLTASGLSVLQTNWRCPAGEVDIIARDGDVLVFVEVKTRSTLAFGAPAEAISAAKATRIRGLAVRWMDERRQEHPGEYWSDLRFDVVAVLRLADGGPEVSHIPGAF